MNIDFKAKQREFVAYIRDPVHHPAPADVSPQRIAMYRELLFNNIDSFLSSNFPVLRTLLNDRQWFELADDFYARHQCRSPYFVEIPEEFLDYLQNERDTSGDWPFLLELAHYEWVEMALSIALGQAVAPPAQKPENLMQQRLCLSPLAWPLAYRYPVQRIAPDFLPIAPPAEPTFLVVYRDADDDVHFLEITPMTYALLDKLQQGGAVLAADCLTQLALEAGQPDSETLIAGGLQIIETLLARSVICLAENTKYTDQDKT